MVYKACEQIRYELATGLKPRLQDLATQAGLTSSHFHRVFKKHTGVTPGQYASGLMESTTRPPSGSLTPDTLFELETPRNGSVSVPVEESRKGDLNLDMGETLVPPMAGLSAVGEGFALSPVSLDPSWEEWNEFDIMLAGEGQISLLDPFSIDPRMLSA